MNVLVEERGASQGFREALLLIICAFVVRQGFLLCGVGQQGFEYFLQFPGDSINYVTSALALYSGTGDSEFAIFTFGPGFPVLLFVIFELFGSHALWPLYVNLLLSSVSCGLIYLIALNLSHDIRIARTAGIASALSITSISLSCILLSDSLYLFLISAGILLYLRTLSGGGWLRAIVSGLLLGASILTRSIGLLTPLVLTAIYFVVGNGLSGNATGALGSKRQMQLKAAAVVTIVIVISALWMIRNEVMHNHFTLALTGATAPGRLAAMTIEEVQGTPERQVREQWVKSYMDSSGVESISLGETFEIYQSKSWEVILNHPATALCIYAKQDWTNWNDISYLHRLIIPDWNHITIPIEQYVLENYLNYIPILIFSFGILLMIFTGQLRIAGVVAILYFSYSIVIGFFQYQGSRYMLPAQIVEWIPLGYLVTWLIGRARSYPHKKTAL